MSTGRLDGFEWIGGNDAGSWAHGPARPRIVAHTTEGKTIEGALAAYRNKNAWPTITCDPKARRKVQHVRYDRPARALANTSAAGETNRTPTTTQVEIVATSVMRPTNGLVSVHDLTDDDLDWLGREVFGPLARATGTPLVAPLPFWPQDCGWTLASPSARQRMSPAEWVGFTGVCAHQHVPENSHWDCGGLDIARILRAAGAPTQPAPTPTEEPLMVTPEDERAIRAIIRDELDQSGLDRLSAAERKPGPMLWRLRNELALQGPRTKEAVIALRSIATRVRRLMADAATRDRGAVPDAAETVAAARLLDQVAAGDLVEAPDGAE